MESHFLKRSQQTRYVGLCWLNVGPTSSTLDQHKATTKQPFFLGRLYVESVCLTGIIISLRSFAIKHSSYKYSTPGPVFSYKLRYIIGFRLVEMAISTNQKPAIYVSLVENTGPVLGNLHPRGVFCVHDDCSGKCILNVLLHCKHGICVIK